MYALLLVISCVSASHTAVPLLRHEHFSESGGQTKVITSAVCCVTCTVVHPLRCLFFQSGAQTKVHCKEAPLDRATVCVSTGMHLDSGQVKVHLGTGPAWPWPLCHFAQTFTASVSENERQQHSLISIGGWFSAR